MYPWLNLPNLSPTQQAATGSKKGTSFPDKLSEGEIRSLLVGPIPSSTPHALSKFRVPKKEEEKEESTFLPGPERTDGESLGGGTKKKGGKESSPLLVISRWILTFWKKYQEKETFSELTYSRNYIYFLI